MLSHPHTKGKGFEKMGMSEFHKPCLLSPESWDQVLTPQIKVEPPKPAGDWQQPEAAWF